ncbi:MAG TPA: hypothetical protein VIT65_20505 [Microlunatus sp.]
MSLFEDDPVKAAAMASAFPIVIASVSASLRDNPDDAALVLAQYHQEAQAQGIKPTTAWALLFSASVIVLAGEVRDQAESYEVKERDILQSIALEVARERS